MQNKNTVKHPLLYAIFCTVFILVFPIAAGVVITIQQTNPLQTTLIQGLFFALAFGFAFLIGKLTFKKMYLFGFNKPKGLDVKKSLYFLPIVIMEMLAFVGGIQKGLTPSIIFSTLLFTFFVAAAEESFFRGIILTALRSKGVGIAVVLSSILFSVGHLTNLAAGADILSTLLQVLFAFAFGLVTAILAICTKSLLIPLILHFIHNTFALLTVAPNTSADTIIAVIQTLILLLYAGYLWQKNKSLLQ